MHKYKELIVWKKSITLVTEIYLVTGSFPDKERFNLISQINRAAVSIPSNIAEGAGRNSDKEFIQFLSIAHASSYELETQLIVSNNLGYIKKEELNKLLESIEELQKMNFSLQQKLKKV
ncbi:four helix bundle protein [Mucilaginibacter sp. PPCGB 2223]|uniref:four helix bundle protein n=1 Tax=Mucilaginibacter sp. PPCGB 2223 TaxID=1886027 RepID=UPI0008269479|nr:four helix bundle protein [Mucilaginibacter sp. PPCGB 2223]OCX50955.1 four helix bundle protein [Mucilaginibacter sp. PPCGB 2223]